MTVWSPDAIFLWMWPRGVARRVRVRVLLWVLAVTTTRPVPEGTSWGRSWGASLSAIAALPAMLWLLRARHVQAVPL